MSLVADGPEIRVCGRGRVEPGERVGQVGGDLVLAHDDQVEVGHQGERAATLAGAVVQDDRAGLGDRDGAAGDDAAHPVEFGRGKRGLVAGQRNLPGQFGQPARGSPSGTTTGPGTAAARAASTRATAAARRRPRPDALDDGAVVGGALGEQGGDVVRSGVMVGTQVPAGQRGVGRVGVGIAVRGAVGGADPGQDLILEPLLTDCLPGSWTTRRGTIPAAGPGRPWSRSTRPAAAAAA